MHKKLAAVTILVIFSVMAGALAACLGTDLGSQLIQVPRSSHCAECGEEPLLGCTVFTLSKGRQVFFGGNDDYSTGTPPLGGGPSTLNMTDGNMLVGNQLRIGRSYDGTLNIAGGTFVIYHDNYMADAGRLAGCYGEFNLTGGKFDNLTFLPVSGPGTVPEPGSLVLLGLGGLGLMLMGGRRRVVRYGPTLVPQGNLACPRNRTSTFNQRETAS